MYTRFLECIHNTKRFKNLDQKCLSSFLQIQFAGNFPGHSGYKRMSRVLKNIYLYTRAKWVSPSSLHTYIHY